MVTTSCSLEVGLAAAMKRLQMNRSRPLLVGNVRGRWQQLADERRPLYEEVAIAAVRTDGSEPSTRSVDAVELALTAVEPMTSRREPHPSGGW